MVSCSTFQGICFLFPPALARGDLATHSRGAAGRVEFGQKQMLAGVLRLKLWLPGFLRFSVRE